MMTATTAAIRSPSDEGNALLATLRPLRAGHKRPVDNKRQAGSLTEADKEIAGLKEQLQEATVLSEAAATAVRDAEDALEAARQEYRARSGQVTMMTGRLSYLEAQRDKLAGWEAGE